MAGAVRDSTSGLTSRSLRITSDDATGEAKYDQGAWDGIADLALGNLGAAPSRTGPSGGSSKGRGRRGTSSGQSTGEFEAENATTYAPVHRREDQCIVALVDNKAFEVGLAAINLRTLEITLMQFGDLADFAVCKDQLFRFEAVEILTPASTCGVSAAVAAFAETCGREVGAQFISRRFFNDSAGSATLKHLAASIDYETQVRERYLTLAAAEAVVRYTEWAQRMQLTPKSVRVTYACPSNRLSIDRQSARLLELIDAAPRPRRPNAAVGTPPSLIGILDRTCTTGGKRLLRANVLAPLSQRCAIEDRQRAVMQLANDGAVRTRLRSALGALRGDFDQLIAHFSHTVRLDATRWIARTIDIFMGLRRVLGLIPDLVSVIEPLCQGPAAPAEEGEGRNLFRIIHTRIGLHHFRQLHALLEAKLDADACAQARIRGGCKGKRSASQVYAVRDPENGLLESLQSAYRRMVEEVWHVVQQLKEDFNVPSMKLCHSDKRGYHLGVDRRDEIKLGDEFLQRVSNGRSVTCTTLQLLSLNEKLQWTHTHVMECTRKVLQELVDGVREDMASLHHVADACALLDLLQSFASVVAEKGWTCVPKFTDDGSTAVVQGRHPIWQRTAFGEYTPNSVEARAEKPFQLLTGPNTSGKTTYLTQVAVTVVLAQLGCAVPADSCELPLHDAVFTRLNFGDCPEAGISTFQLEMREIANVLSRATQSSLVLIDELGRGTSHHDGAAIAYACAEWLIRKRCTTLFVTHFNQLHRLASVYHSVENRHMAVRTANRELHPIFRLQRGTCNIDSYGLRLAEQHGYPEDVVEEAGEFAAEVRRREQEHQQSAAAEGPDGYIRGLMLKLKNYARADVTAEERKGLYARLARDFAERLSLDPELSKRATEMRAAARRPPHGSPAVGRQRASAPGAGGAMPPPPRRLGVPPAPTQQSPQRRSQQQQQQQQPAPAAGSAPGTPHRSSQSIDLGVLGAGAASAADDHSDHQSLFGDGFSRSGSALGRTPRPTQTPRPQERSHRSPSGHLLGTPTSAPPQRDDNHTPRSQMGGLPSQLDRSVSRLQPSSRSRSVAERSNNPGSPRWPLRLGDSSSAAAAAPASATSTPRLSGDPEAPPCTPGTSASLDLQRLGADAIRQATQDGQRGRLPSFSSTSSATRRRRRSFSVTEQPAASACPPSPVTTDAFSESASAAGAPLKRMRLAAAAAAAAPRPRPAKAPMTSAQVQALLDEEDTQLVA